MPPCQRRTGSAAAAGPVRNLGEGKQIRSTHPQDPGPLVKGIQAVQQQQGLVSGHPGQGQAERDCGTVLPGKLGHRLALFASRLATSLRLYAIEWFT